jgi:hypothetical protein
LELNGKSQAATIQDFYLKIALVFDSRKMSTLLILEFLLGVNINIGTLDSEDN